MNITQKQLDTLFNCRVIFVLGRPSEARRLAVKGVMFDNKQPRRMVDRYGVNPNTINKDLKRINDVLQLIEDMK